ncbi:hypothetical protein ACFWWN_27325, partial [Streptomyces sp. NPDC059082]
MPVKKLRWEERTQTPLLVLAVAFGLAYAVPIVAPGAEPWGGGGGGPAPGAAGGGASPPPQR